MSIQESLGAGSGSLLNSIVAAMASRYQEKAVKKMDADGSGTVDKSEFQAALDKVSEKYGVPLGQNAEALFASSDGNTDGALDASEVGRAIQNLFAPTGGQTGTQAFVQNRGDEARFAELDTDGDGTISRAEFGIGEGTVISTTTVTTTTVISQDGGTGLGGAEALAALAAGAAPAPSPAAASGAGDALAGWQTGAAEVVGSTPPAAADTALASADTPTSSEDAVQGDTLQALLKQADTDGDGQISANELGTLVSQLSAQMEAASRRYNDIALANSGLTGASNGGLSASA